MGDILNISVLSAAKEEYMNQLKHYLAPLIQEGFESIYEDARLNEPTAVLRQFQIFLKQIPRWNQTLLETETKRIRDKCPFLMDLVTAIFVSHVKILASVRLGGDHKNIKLKIPTSEIFIHGIYVNSAEKFYYEPYPFSEFNSHKNKETIKDIIEETIEETISSLIPIQDILQEYLSSAFSNYTKPLPPPPEPQVPPPFRVFDGNEIIGGTKEFSIGDQPPFHDKLDSIKTIPPLSIPTEPFNTSAPPFSTSFGIPTESFSAPTEPFSAPTESFSAPTEPFSAPSAPTEPFSAPSAPTESSVTAVADSSMPWLESPKSTGSFFGDSGSLPD